MTNIFAGSIFVLIILGAAVLVLGVGYLALAACLMVLRDTRDCLKLYQKR